MICLVSSTGNCKYAFWAVCACEILQGPDNDATICCQMDVLSEGWDCVQYMWAGEST